MQTDLLGVKKEEVNDKPLPTLPRTTKGKGKEPVRQTVHEEASDVPEDESMDDNEHLFGTFAPLTATNCLSHTHLRCSSELSPPPSFRLW